MKKISFDTIAAASERVNLLGDDEHIIETFVSQFTNAQPAIVDYLLHTYSDELSEAHSEYLFFLGCKIWEAIRTTYPTVPQITGEQIDAAEEDNEQMLNYLADESDEGLENFAEILLQDYSQNELMEFIIFAVSEDDDEDEEQEEEEEEPLTLDDDTRGIFFITLKTMVDCFDKAIA
jgi:hypothetical protein